MIKTFGAPLPADPESGEAGQPAPAQTRLAATIELVFALTSFVLLAGFLPPMMYFVAGDFLPDIPFAKYASRALLVGAVLALGPVMWRQWQLSRREAAARAEAESAEGIDNKGFRAMPALSGMGGGFLAGVLSLAALCLAHMATGAREWSGGLQIQTGINAMVTGWLISVAEELVFRGGLQLLLIRIAGGPVGWIIAALLFALAHFLKPGTDYAPSTISVTWFSGFEALGWAAAPLANPDTYGTAFIAYLLVGLILGGLAWGTGNLWAAIGLHAGWVFALKVGSVVTKPTGGAHTGMGDLLTGIPSLAVLGATGIAVAGWLLWRQRARMGSSKTEALVP
ncbi:MAG: CPBP family intramembrane glutamic endopeptidase [Candidatus Methylacidiphilales bacterium]|nr:CPBP family intramembrane glutamic endopeptidase [Candidatus Methylacidiphilales bacterium]